MSIESFCNSFVKFSNDWWTGVSKDMPQLIRGKVNLNTDQNTRVSLVCEASKLAWIVLGITFVAAALFTGPLGTIGFVLGAIVAYDKYKISSNIQQFVEGNSDSRQFLENTLISAAFFKAMKSIFVNSKN